MTNKLPKKFLNLLNSVKDKRPKTVIAHILKHGQITTEELKELYGYNHPPRAIRDVREHGIPIVTSRITGSDGRKIAAYKFGSFAEVRATKLSGRTAFSKKLKEELLERHGAICNISMQQFPPNALQIDHRIPFEIAGDGKALSENLNDYMLLSASANRAKSWSCENCKNWQNKDARVCRGCYWAHPESYQHVAMHDIRRLDIVWSGAEVVEYDNLMAQSEKAQKTMPAYVKEVLEKHLKNTKG